MGYGLVIKWARVRAAMRKKAAGEEYMKEQPREKTTAPDAKQAGRGRHFEEESDEKEGYWNTDEVACQVAEHLSEVADWERGNERAGIDLVVSVGEGT